ncbi:MAG: DUF3536 domain-containing protein [Gemmatimonadaceae bacterium]|nr:DUF3536 domain-containing protein [Gemmatimonadaceae bacterium]
MHHVVVHAHCYQPPREDPWLETVETEPSAAPDHDWNARIDRECYARLAQAEVRQRHAGATVGDPDAPSGIARLVNLYAWCTFDVGATLCEWLEREAPDTLRAMIDGDAASVRRWGHGNAIAAPYHHVILPLASLRDRRTEVRWGIADFQRRFGRTPEGMWLPECAADDETLDVLAQEGIRFTILAPYQVQTAGETHGLPVRWRGAHGRTLTILPYDGGLAGEVAFGGLLRNPTALAQRLAPAIADGQPRCTTLATDGETFGHHHKNGDRTLALAMALIAQRPDARLINAAAMVAMHAPTQDAHLVSPSSWSCAHGIERWRSNCGCRIDHGKPAAQQWRGPLREALSALAQQSDALFEQEGRSLFADDPWHVRDAYGTVVATDGAPLRRFVRGQTRADLDAVGVQRAQQLLEMQRATLRLFTSCAWFFDEVERIETRQVLRYAARVLELSGFAAQLEPELIQGLDRARAGPDLLSAGALFVRDAAPYQHAAWRIAAGAMAMVAAGYPCPQVAAYDITHAPSPSAAFPHATTLVHRRTGRVSRVIGRVTGLGPSRCVTVKDAAADMHDERVVAVHEMPESIATVLLRAHVLDDAALTG